TSSTVARRTPSCGAPLATSVATRRSAACSSSSQAATPLCASVSTSDAPIIREVIAQRTRVALADDDVLLREGLARILQQAGCEIVGQTGTAADLIDLVERQNPDLCIVDIRMPPTHKNEGLEAARLIRQSHPDTAIVILSAHVQVEPAAELLATGARTAYLLKRRVSDVDDFVSNLSQ